MITTAKWTLEQYHQMIDAGILEDQSVELLNGWMVSTNRKSLSQMGWFSRWLFQICRFWYGG